MFIVIVYALNSPVYSAMTILTITPYRLYLWKIVKKLYESKTKATTQVTPLFIRTASNPPRTRTTTIPAQHF
uniref:Uncharacterized protein n=1 Tax=Acrobeloides nanus TaxID=290746 RepID=A0A914D7A9_9BILA